MGDAPGELADRLHLLRLTQLGLELFALGDVDPGADHFHRVSRRVVPHAPLVEDPAVRSVPVAEAVLDRELPGAELVRQLPADAVPVLRVDVSVPPVRAQRLRHLVAGEPADVLAHVLENGDVPGDATGVDHGIAGAHELLEARARRLQLAHLGFQPLLGLPHVLRHYVERFGKPAELVPALHPHLSRVVPGRDRLGGAREPPQPGGDGAAQPPRGEEADEEHGTDFEHLAAQEQARRGEDHLPRKLDHDGPGGPAHRPRGREHPAGAGSSVLDDPGGRALKIKGRRRRGDARHQVRPQVSRRVRHVEPGAGADQLVELPPTARRARQMAHLNEIPQDAAALLDRHRHRVAHRITHDLEGAYHSRVRAAAGLHHLGVDGRRAGMGGRAVAERQQARAAGGHELDVGDLLSRGADRPHRRERRGAHPWRGGLQERSDRRAVGHGARVGEELSGGGFQQAGDLGGDAPQAVARRDHDRLAHTAIGRPRERAGHREHQGADEQRQLDPDGERREAHILL